jgi:tRNA threonylcarbamoyladenosine biosynthesis protein TsaB
MLVLAADTSGKEGRIALVHFESGAQTLDVVDLEGGTFSAQLIPQIAALLDKHHLSKSDIGAFAVVSGPGSFTGLRVGLAAIKALAEILRKPIAAVSLLEAVARIAPQKEGRIVSALDAGRGEIYRGTYAIASGHATCISQELKTVSEFVATSAGSTVVTPDGKLAQMFGEGKLNVIRVERPRADAIATLGFEKILAGETVSPEALDASYIRRSDAEIKKTPF